MVDIIPPQNLTTAPDRRMLSQLTNDPKLIRYLENLGLDIQTSGSDSFAALLMLINDVSEAAYNARGAVNTLRSAVDELIMRSGEDVRDSQKVMALARKIDDIESTMLDYRSPATQASPYSPALITSTGAMTVQPAPPYQPTTIRANAAGGGFSVTLPASPIILQLVNIKKVDATANVVTISGGAINIDGATTVAIGSQYTNLQVQFNGASWDVL